MKHILLFLTMSAVFLACDNASNSETTDEAKQELMVEAESLLKADTLLHVNFNGFPFDVQLKVPDGPQKGALLVLQGWNFPITDWCDSTDLCTVALDRGYVLVMPDMGKSIYSENVYPQTREDWINYPTRQWLRDEVIPLLQKNYELFLPGKNNYVVGLSTGGRGALFMALERPSIFKGCATLSGDYDQYMFPNDNLYIGYFGPMKANQDLWRGKENPTRWVGSLRVPLYVGHGLKDRVVPYRHMELLKEHIDFYNLETKVIYHIDSTAGHDYEYWESEVYNVLDFFSEN